MKKAMSRLVIALMAAVFLSACATSYQPVSPISTTGIDASGHALKTQNAVFILDASSSMEADLYPHMTQGGQGPDCIGFGS